MKAKVTSYRVTHKLGGLTTISCTRIIGGLANEYSLRDLQPAEAALIIDLLRNESPVYLDLATNTITVGAEPAGEGEPAPGKG